jgi:hypothetical protein
VKKGGYMDSYYYQKAWQKQYAWAKNKYGYGVASYWDRATETFKRFATYLNILDQDPDTLARMFERLGIKGGVNKCCPVAVYLGATPALKGVEVGADALKFKGRLIHLPKNVQRFIQRFDNGEFPELEAS